MAVPELKIRVEFCAEVAILAFLGFSASKVPESYAKMCSDLGKLEKFCSVNQKSPWIKPAD